jgi:hypothetical protein
MFGALRRRVLFSVVFIVVSSLHAPQCLCAGAAPPWRLSDRTDMNLLDTVRRQVRNYPGGIDVVALRLGKSVSTLEKELRGAPGFKLGAEDAAEISAMCMEVRSEHAGAYATALAARMNCMLVPMPLEAEVRDSECYRAACEVSRQAASHLSEVLAALADGRITDNELLVVDRARGQYFAADHMCRRMLGELNRAGKPASEVR